MSDFYCDEVFSGRTKVTVRHDTGEVVAFDHTRPAYDRAHIVVVPRRHVRDLLEVDAALLHAIVDVVRLQAGTVFDKYGACRVITNLGDYQDSKHLHWHIVSGTPLPQ